MQTLAALPLIILALFHIVPRALAQDPVSAVNPFIGTGGHGHTFPGATVPFGMVQLSPDTRVEGWDACGGYHYSDSSILGFSHTHLSGTGVPDYGDILVMPGTADLPLKPGEESQPGSGYRSRFSHADETASPGYYSVLLGDSRVRAELTATQRTGMHKYTYPAGTKATLIVDLHHGLGPDRVLSSEIRAVSDTEIVGFRRSAGWARDQCVYFVMRFSRPVVSLSIADGGAENAVRARKSTTGARARLGFGVADEAPLYVKVGLSGVDIEGARKNIDAENPVWDFEAIRAKAADAWRAELSRIEIDGGTKKERTVFYTALYHAMIAPNTWSDVDGRYRGMDARVHHAYDWTMYTVFSLWDTFRALHPLLSITDRRRTQDFARSMVAKGREAKVLPVWELAANETWCMIGYHSVPVLVDAYLKGINDFNASEALSLMKRGATTDRFGLFEYMKHGYIPGESESESVSKTLEYAYDDWCIATFARSMDRDDEARTFDKRAQSWKNLFDPATGFMRARVNGNWAVPFDPTSVTNHYTEANSWQYSFFVPHDISGLIDAFGGDNRFISRLDELFSTSSTTAGRQQSDITGMIGQYAQGNEPSHHVAYLYNYAGAPWKTQQIVRKILDSLFHDSPDGICGNDDCGQMSAWYVMSALGFYQVCPGRLDYALGTPLFPSARLRLENGKVFEIRADRPAQDRRFIQSLSLNGAAVSRSFLTHDEFMRGGTLSMTMGTEPNLMFGAADRDRPVSSMNARAVVAPLISAPALAFPDSMRVTITTASPAAEIMYAIGDHPRPSDYRPYLAPIVIAQSATINAFARAGRDSSGSAKAAFVRHQPAGTLTLKTRYQPQYSAGGDNALLDGIRGEEDFRIGAWQGWEKDDLDVIVDLGSVTPLRAVGLSCLQDNNAWIFFPKSVTFQFSNDGINYVREIKVDNTIPDTKERTLLRIFETQAELSARYIRVLAKNLGVCPPWHKGAGGKAWIFADEIVVVKRKK